MTTLLGSLTDRDSWPDVGPCPIETTLRVVGTKSAMLVMREAFYGTTRFDDFARRVGMTRTATSTRLAELIEAGLLAKKPYHEPGRRSRDEYVLTDAGRAFTSVMWAMFEWGREHLDESTRLRLIHRDCGAEVSVQIRCAKRHNVTPDKLALAMTGD